MTDEENDERIGRIVDMARLRASEKQIATAAVYYEAAFVASQGLKTPVQRLACGEACAWKAESAMLAGMHGTAAGERLIASASFANIFRHVSDPI